MTTPIQIKRDTAANWTTANPVLLSGQEGLETDTRRRKTGDGVTAWNSLGYDGASAILAAPATLNAANVAKYSSGAPVSLAAGATLTIDISAYAGLTAALTVYTAAGGTSTVAFSGGALKENAAGTSAANVTLGASGVYVITQSPTGAGVFRVVGGASL